MHLLEEQPYRELPAPEHDALFSWSKYHDGDVEVAGERQEFKLSSPCPSFACLVV